MKHATLMTLSALTLSANVAAADLTGKWTINGDVVGNPVTLNCDLKQAQAKLSGTCDVNGADKTELAGDVTDTSVQFSITVQGYTLNYSGKIEGDKVTGGIEVAGASGTFEGQRAK